MLKRNPADASAAAEILALKALAFLAADEARFGRFLDLTGLTLDEIRNRAGEPDFLAAVMSHLRGDQTLLLVFAEAEGLDPSEVDRAGRALAGELPP